MPIFICTVLYDFEKGSEKEISIKKDEELFVFELTTHDWIYVNSLDRSRKGYVPSKVVKINNEIDLGFVLETHLSKNDDDLSVGAGEIFIIEGKLGDGFICRRALDDNYGYLQKNILVLRSSIKSIT